MKKLQRFSGVSWMPAPLQPLRTPFRIASFSSEAYKSAMSPMESLSKEFLCRLLASTSFY